MSVYIDYIQMKVLRYYVSQIHFIASCNSRNPQDLINYTRQRKETSLPEDLIENSSIDSDLRRD